VMGIPINQGQPQRYQPGGGGYQPGYQEGYPVGQPHRRDGGDYAYNTINQDDDFGGQEQCAVVCCGACCPCCTGDPSTPEWWKEKFVRTWFQTFTGLCGLGMFVMFVILNAVSPHDSDIGGYLSINYDTLEDMGAKDTIKIVRDFEVWRLLTCLFLHAGWIHFLLNLFVMMTQGWLIETGLEIIFGVEHPAIYEPFGLVNAMVIFLFSGVAGSLFGSVLDPGILCVGASPAIMGIFGGKLAVFILHATRGESALENELPEISMKRKMDACLLFFWCILIFSLGLGNPMIDNWGHFGALFTGCMMGMVIFSDAIIQPEIGMGDQVSPFRKHASKISLATVLLYFTICFVVLYTVVEVPAHLETKSVPWGTWNNQNNHKLGPVGNHPVNQQDINKY